MGIDARLLSGGGKMMRKKKFRRVAGRYIAVFLIGFSILPSTGAFSEYNFYESKQYISDIGLIELYDSIVKHADIVAGGVVGVGLIHLETGRELYLNKNERFPMASSVKVPLAVQMMDLVDQGRISLDDLITIQRSDFSPGSGNIKHRFPPGRKLSLRYLMENMLTVSDNSATDIIFRTVGGPASVDEKMKEFGIEGMSVDRPIYILLSNIWGVTSLTESDPFSLQILNNLLARVSNTQKISARRDFFVDPRDTSTPEAMAKLLEKIWHQDILSPASSELLLDIMAKSGGNRRIKGLLPPGTRVYRKTGTIRGGLSDVGIVELPDGAGHLVVSVFVKGGTTPRAEQAMALIARDAFNHFRVGMSLSAIQP